MYGLIQAYSHGHSYLYSYIASYKIFKDGKHTYIPYLLVFLPCTAWLHFS